MRAPHSTSRGPVPAHRSADHAPESGGREVGGTTDLARHLTALRDVVTTQASARRAEGRPLEWVLTEMQGLVRRAERLEGWPDELGVLVGQVRLWTVAGYAEEPELRNVPRFY